MSEKSPMSHCTAPISAFLQIVSNKWAFPVMAELLRENQRFNQLRRNLGEITARGLTNILKQLEKEGMVTRHVIPTNPISVEYRLTDKGEDFKRVLEEVNIWRIKWGEK